MGLSKTASGGRQYERFIESDKITVCHCSVVFISFSYGVVGMTNLKKAASASIWWFAFGYFAVYIPYSFGTKVLTKGLLADNTMDAAQKAALTVSSGELLPPTILASIVVMIIFISSMRWWKYATQWHLGGLSLPRPRLSTLFSGICTGVVVVTTTLAYTINGVTIVTAMLFMRGGMLIMSPIVDTLFKRHVRWFSWAALGMSLLALIVSSLWLPIYDGNLSWETMFGQPVMFWVDLAAYLGAYFVRLTMMSKKAKSKNADDTKKFFVEEQMVGTPSIFIILAIASLFAPTLADLTDPATGVVSMGGFGGLLYGVHAGFTSFWSRPSEVILIAMGIGLFSQFNGVFGGLILLYPSENSFAVPVNRCSSILAGVVATLALVAVFGDKYPLPMPQEAGQFVGAAFVVGAILFLALPKYLAGKKQHQLNASNASEASGGSDKAESKEVSEASNEDSKDASSDSDKAESKEVSEASNEDSKDASSDSDKAESNDASDDSKEDSK